MSTETARVPYMKKRSRLHVSCFFSADICLSRSLVACVLLAASLPAQVRTKFGIMIPMRNGVRLADDYGSRRRPVAPQKRSHSGLGGILDWRGIAKSVDRVTSYEADALNRA